MNGGVTVEIGGRVAEIGGEVERERHEREWKEESWRRRWVSRERFEAGERMGFERE
ncbi:hypothetical protein TIFTF001_021879 [Ficus carica]|uniref:Uncharacterized protein n=1 Tax=Ficus carica TaxID=3494 RepID=A0AA88AT25_FICCA|nr:hypothetical protein TIFTF001_021879 [Ficus carica]